MSTAADTSSSATFDVVVVVESPSKAQKIQKYLGPAYKARTQSSGHGPVQQMGQLRLSSEACATLLLPLQVLASYGHIRDLPPKTGAVDPAANFSMQWVVAPAAKPRLAAIKTALKAANCLVLATDPDREGEAIAWHLLEELKVRCTWDRSQCF